ncbi:MAG: hypothetical protein ABSD57_00475 [Verrucomicrobiota bacterium]
MNFDRSAQSRRLNTAEINAASVNNRLLTFNSTTPYLNGMNLIANLSAKQLRRAAAIKDKIQSLENELGRVLGSPTKPAAVAAPKKRRKMSAAGRARIAAAARARWAKVKGKKSKTAPARKPKRQMSAAAKAKISAAAKARWAKIKTAKSPSA